MTANDASDCDDGGTEVVCHKCNYSWEYVGEMWRATCPRCGAKTDTGLKPDDFD